jgi:hypothetical protein
MPIDIKSLIISSRPCKHGADSYLEFPALACFYPIDVIDRIATSQACQTLLLEVLIKYIIVAIPAHVFLSAYLQRSLNFLT